MSVNKSDRTDKSELCYLAEQAEYKIIKMTMNEKYFPKRARFIITYLKTRFNLLENGKILKRPYRKNITRQRRKLKN